LPSLTTSEVTGITKTGGISGGNVTSQGGTAVTARGVCWSTATITALTANKTSDGSGTGTYTSEITGLTAGTAYFVRAYATNGGGTKLGNEVTFTSTPDVPVKPTVTTALVNSVTSNSAACGGNVTNEGSASVTARGVCWSTSPNPTIINNTTNDGTGPGAFTSSMTGLNPGTTYYVRAYATNSAGTSYGSESSFPTIAVLPTLSTITVNSVTSASAASGGNITSDGGATITARGVCWSTSPNPTISDGHSSDGLGAGPYTSSLTPLTGNTTYYYRAYATNSVGTAYGNELNFKTDIIVPVLTTTAVTSITSTTALSGGNITSDGGSSVTARGVCWSTSSNPTTSNSKTNDGSGTGSFTSSLLGLTPGTSYHVRAYAVTSAGIGYGPDVQFLSAPGLPTVSTSSITDITSTSATS
jgi:hypothetical protein